MKTIIRIPEEMAKTGNLVLIPQNDYEEFLAFLKKREREKKDIESAIKVFQKEKQVKKLAKINSLSEIR